MEGTIKVMSSRGDDPIRWDPEKPDTVTKAKEQFDALKAKGYKAFKLVKKTIEQRGEQVNEFDPSHTDGYLMTPALAGG